GLELRFHIRRTGSQRIRPTLDNIRLYCTPVVNLFAHDATPIRLDGRQDHYLLRPAEYAPQHCGVYSVENITGWKPGGMGHAEYVPFESFEHDHSTDNGQAKPYYSVRQYPSISGDGLETFLSFGPHSSELHETLSIELTCTNQNLPSQLGLGDICCLAEDTPDFLSFRNISAVTPSYTPPLDSDFLWKLISNMSLNYLSLTNVEALRAMLQNYDLPRHYDQHAARIGQHRLDGLRHISHRHVDRLHGGLPVRGVRTELEMDVEYYLSEGELFLFASVLNEFFALYASLNSFHELRVRTNQGERYQWTPRMGLQPLLCAAWVATSGNTACARASSWCCISCDSRTPIWMRMPCPSASSSVPTRAWASRAPISKASNCSTSTASCALACASIWSACSAPARRCRPSTASRRSGTAWARTLPGIFSTCSTTACSGCCCRSGASTATTAATAPAPGTWSPGRCSR